MSFTPFPNEIYTVFSFFGLIMCIIPLPCHLKAWNAGTCLLMFWAGMGCLVFFVNSIVWHGNTSNSAPIWCDICVKFIIGSFSGIPASSLCINRRLYLLQLDPARNFALTKSDKIRSLTIDLGISFALPAVFMILHYVHQGSRFDIYEDMGCLPNNYNTWVSILLLNIPPIILGLVSATYGICAIISINKKRYEFNNLLALRQNITSSLYFRLMCYAGIEALTTTPIAVYFVVIKLTLYPLLPWISWENSHLGIHTVGVYPATLWHTFPFARAYEFIRWLHVLSAIIFFVVFGFAKEAKSHYRRIVKFFLKLTGIRIGRQTELEVPISLKTGPRSYTSQSDPANSDRLTFGDKRPCQVDFPTMPIFPGHGRSGGRSPLDTDLRDYPGDQGSQMGPGVYLSNPRSPAPIEQENERTPSIRANLRSFLNLGHNDSSPHFVQSEMDISTIEEGRPSRSNRSQLSRPFHSFLNFN